MAEKRQALGRGLSALIPESPAEPPPVPVNYVSDLSLVTQELGWLPEVSVEDGLKTLF